MTTTHIIASHGLAIKPVDPSYTPRNSIKMFMPSLRIDLASEEDIEQPTQDPPICAICDGIAASPMVTSCSLQLICIKCAQGRSTCPLCHKKKCLRSNIGQLKEFVKLFTGICPYHTHGCEAIFPLTDLERHLEECGHTVYICKCKARMRRNRISDHCRSECPLRVQPCNYCDKYFHQQDMQSHVDDMHPQCEYCQDHHAPGDERHMPQPCPIVGCEREIPPCSINEHVKMVHSEDLIAENQRLRELIEDYKQMEMNLVDELEAKNAQIASLRSQIPGGPIPMDRPTAPALRPPRSSHGQNHVKKVRAKKSLFKGLMPLVAKAPHPEPVYVPSQKKKSYSSKYLLSHFHPTGHGTKCSVEDGGCSVLQRAVGCSTSLLHHPGLFEGVVTWGVQVVKCSKSHNYIGVVAVSSLRREGLEGSVGWDKSVPGIGLQHNGDVWSDTRRCVQKTGARSFRTGSIVFVTLDMDSMNVTFQVGADGRPHTESLKHTGKFVLCVSLNQPGDKFSIVSCVAKPRAVKK